MASIRDESVVELCAVCRMVEGIHMILEEKW